MLADRFKVIAVSWQHLHDRFRNALDRPPNLLHLGGCQAPARFARTAATVAHDVQEGFALPNPKGPLRHTHSANW